MDNFSTMMIIGECLFDKKRTNAFEKAIRNTVKHGDVVLDGGTGSGIMSLLAARAGAKKVYAVEINPEVAKWTEMNVKNNGYSNVVQVINSNLNNAKLPHVDVVIMEMMDTGLVFEHQGPAMNNLVINGTVDEHTKLIPSIFETYIEFANYDFGFYGFRMPFLIQARNFGVRQNIKSKISGKIRINKIDFHNINKLEQDITLEAEAIDTGLINSLVLSSRIKLSEGQMVWGTTDMNMPSIIPVEDRNVKKGQKIKFNITYKMGAGFDKFKFRWII